MSTDVAVGHSSSPSVTAYPWSAGFGSKYANPGTTPAGYGQAVAFSATAADLAVGSSGSPGVTAYPWSSGFGTKYANPGTAVAGYGYGVAFAAADVAVASTSTPYVQAYPWSAGFGTKYANPGTLPGGAGRGVTFSPSSAAVVVCNAGSPQLTAYPWSAGFGSKYANPGTLPTGFNATFSPSGGDVAATSSGSPYVLAYPWLSGFGTKYANAGTLPASYGRAVAFSTTGADLAVSTTGSPGVTAYPWSSGFGTKYANPGTLPTGYGFGVAFTTAAVAIAHFTSPNVSAYPWSAGFGSKYANPGTTPTGYGRGVACTPAAAGIGLDAVSNSTYQTAQSTYSWSHTCTGSNRFLAVDVAILSVPGTTVTGITYNGVALSLIGAKSTVSGAGRIECWGLANPATGANTIAVTLSASVASAGVAVSYTGAHQSSPTEAFNSAQATNVGAADATVSITTVADNDWVHGALATDDGSVTANQTTRNNVSGGVGSGANEDTGPQTPAGAVTVSYTGMGALATWAIGGYAVRPVAAASLSNRRRRAILLGG